MVIEITILALRIEEFGFCYISRTSPEVKSYTVAGQNPNPSKVQ